ncbi:MAG: AhpC/TSA family protein [Methylococcales bacterium]|nr:AhpC/TSA family protein [Methylococcales bacterium]
MSLATQLEETLNSFVGSLSEQAQQTVGQSMQQLMESNVADNAINVGSNAPDFTLPSTQGDAVKLSELLAKGPVVISFFRGGWCPFCNLEFKALMDKLPEIEACNATLVTISPETMENSKATVEKFSLTYTVLSDVGNVIAKEYGLLMTVSEDMRPLYLEWGIDVPTANGDDTYELPVPATYIIGNDGVVKYAYINKNYTSRMQPEEIIEKLKEC